ncbi:hypothetical protein [Nocardia flavorosea]|uniref:hypothetical protein n=1 Tax=Nocardia flavorosea TaxID=53429 RepID=UPI0024574D2F|nr:hypothetical protein [Nocardia flavorosea]
MGVLLVIYSFVQGATAGGLILLGLLACAGIGVWIFVLIIRALIRLGANDAVAAENSFNEPPPAGSQYLLANVTITYIGTDPQGETPFSTISYVTADGNTVNSFDNSAVEPDALDTLSPLFQGASTTGNVAFTVPSASATQGTLAVEPAMFSDKIFVAVS